MSRHPKPWFRKGRGWFVQLDGNQVNLGRDKQVAMARFYELMRDQKTSAANHN